MSTLHFEKDGSVSPPRDYWTESDREIRGCVQTNEAAICALVQQLAEQDKKLSHIFYFASNKATQEKKIDGEMISDAAYVERHLKQELCPVLQDTHFHEIAYNEDDTAEKNIHGIGKMADIIAKVMSADDTREHNAVLHADITGGIRYANMMMLSVMRLMEYSGIRVEKIFYADYFKHRVSSTRDVYRSFALISGVDEFVKYGSVRAIEEYFSDDHATVSKLETRESSIELDNLLCAMHEFSDTIRICRTTRIEKNLQDLRDTLSAFLCKPDKTLREDFFAALMRRLQSEYGALLAQEKKRRLDIIRWCRRKEFLQQATTLCTEWLPGYFVENGIYYTDSEDVIRQCENNQLKRPWQVEFIVNFQKKKDAAPDSIIKKLRALFLCMKENENFVVDSRQIEGLAEKHFPVLRELQQLDHIRMQYGNRIAAHLPSSLELLRHLYRQRRAIGQLGTYTFDEFLRTKCKRAYVLNIMHTLPEADIEKFFELTTELPKGGRPGSDENDAKTNGKYARLLRQGIARTNYDVPKVLEILEYYNEIRKLRNQINHADEDALRRKSEEELTVRLIEEKLDACLARIDALAEKGAKINV